MNITKLTSTKTICNSYLIEEGGFVVIIDPGQDGVVETEIDNKGYTPEYIRVKLLEEDQCIPGCSVRVRLLKADHRIMRGEIIQQ